jgi:hypothetical protein
MDDADRQLARSIRNRVRLVLYPTLLILLAVAWHARSSANADDSVKWLGFTGQGKQMTAVTSRDGLLLSFDAHVSQQCSDGSTTDLHWSPGRHVFVQQGQNVSGRQHTKSRDNHGRADAGDSTIRLRFGAHASGTLRVLDTVAGTLPIKCDSGPVFFELSRR